MNKKSLKNEMMYNHFQCQSYDISWKVVHRGIIPHLCNDMGLSHNDYPHPDWETDKFKRILSGRSWDIMINNQR